MAKIEQLLSIQEVAKAFGVPVSTVYGWRARRQGPPSVRLGKHVRYRAADVEKWLAERVERAS